MTEPNVTSMSLTSVSAGQTVAMSSSSGTVSTTSKVLALAGYELSMQETTSGLAYQVVTVTGQIVTEAPPTVLVAADYVQTVAFDEVDLDVRYQAIPTGTSLQITSTQPKFVVSKREIHGTDNVGLMGTDLGVFSDSLVIKLWIAQPSSLTSESELSISFSRIESGTGGPSKKTLLEKLVVKLAS